MSKISKVVYGGDVLIDLTSDTVSADKLAYGYTAHGADGELITGSSTKDSDTSGDDATAAEILSGKTAHARGSQLTGSMTNNGAVAGIIDEVDEEYTVPAGYHDGSGKVKIDTSEQAKIIATNIRQGVTILGVEGSMTGTEDVVAEAKNATPSTTAQTLLPGTGYNYISQVNLAAIPYTETANAAGGLTATIA
jgi:hypothetical protein